MPGFVDCHTHACWAGDRLDEWEMKLAGRSYLDILAAELFAVGLVVGFLDDIAVAVGFSNE